MRLLLDHGARADATDKEGRTPLEVAGWDVSEVKKIFTEHAASRVDDKML